MNFIDKDDDNDNNNNNNDDNDNDEINDTNDDDNDDKNNDDDDNDAILFSCFLGLNCNLIISKYPVGAPVTGRFIDTLILCR
jgi:hypothetical protein